MKILFRNITKYHISISVCNQPFWMNDCEWFSHDVCESVTRCVTSDGVSGCLISAGSRVPPSAGVIMTLTGIMTLLTPDCWLVTPLTLGAPPPPSRHSRPVLLSWSQWPSHHDRWREERGGWRAAATWHRSRWEAESDPDPYWVLRAHNHHTYSAEQSGHWVSAARCSAA